MLITPLPSHARGAAVALWEDVGLTRPWNDPYADLDRAIAGRTSTVLALMDGQALLGTAMVGHDGHRGWVYYLAVTPAAQGRGLGRQLMQGCAQWVRDQDIPKIQLMVRSTNTAALGFYAALGYQDAEVTVMARRFEPHG
jgi:ribosomal protein S18 acetylase RimI-like enzyme